MPKKIAIIGAGTAACAYLKLIIEAGQLKEQDEVYVLGGNDPWGERHGNMGQRSDVHSLDTLPVQKNQNPLKGFTATAYNQAESHAALINSWRECLDQQSKIKFINCRVNTIRKISDAYTITSTPENDLSGFTKIILATGAGDQSDMTNEQWPNNKSHPYYTGAGFLDGYTQENPGKRALIYGAGATAAWCVRKARELYGPENVTWLARYKSPETPKFSERVSSAWVASGINDDIKSLIEQGQLDCAEATVERLTQQQDTGKYECRVENSKGKNQVYEQTFDIIIAAIGQKTPISANNPLLDDALKQANCWTKIHIDDKTTEPIIGLTADNGNILVIGAAVNSFCETFRDNQVIDYVDANTLYSDLSRFSISSAQVPAGIPYLLASLCYLVQDHQSTISANMLSPTALDKLLSDSISGYLDYMFKPQGKKLLGHSKEHVISVITDQIIGFTQPNASSHQFGLNQYELNELWWLLKQSSWQYVTPSQGDCASLAAIKAVMDDIKEQCPASCLF